MRHWFKQFKHDVRKAFTLVEILIVVVILGILAALVIPQVGSVVNESKASSLLMDLKTVRSQIGLYRTQHEQHPTLDDFGLQLTKYTDEKGNTNLTKTPVFKYGPYLQRIPANPYTGKNNLSTDDPGESDWYYNPVTGEFHANDTAETRTY